MPQTKSLNDQYGSNKFQRICFVKKNFRLLISLRNPMFISSSKMKKWRNDCITQLIILKNISMKTLLKNSIIFLFNGRNNFKYCHLAKTKSYLLFAFFLLLITNEKSIAQTAISPEEAISIALQNNNIIRAKSLEIKASQSLRKTAYEMPKMDLNAQLGQYNSINFDNGYQIAQSIPFPTLFGAKRQLTNAEIKGKEWQQEISVNELKSQVRSYYYELIYLQHNKKKLQHLDSLYADFSNVSVIRYKAGETKKLELSTAESKRGSIRLLLQQNEVSLANAYSGLKALMNYESEFIISEAVYSPLQISTVLDSSIIANHPGIKALYQEGLISEQNIKVQRAQSLPDLRIGYNNQSLIGFQTIDNRNIYFGADKRFSAMNLGITVPLFSATRGKVQALKYQKEASEANALYQQKMLTTQLQHILLQYNQDLQQYNYYLQQALPNASEIVSAAQLGYRSGDINYIEYLYALQTATDIELKYLQAIHQVNQTVISIYSILNK